MCGLRICRTAEEFKAWSQNYGHNKVLTTLTSYETVPLSRQEELIGDLCNENGLFFEDFGFVDGKAVEQAISVLQRVKHNFEPS